MNPPEELQRLKALHERYGIPFLEGTRVYPSKLIARSGQPVVEPDWTAIAAEVMEEHRDVLRALAKR